jgi:hypothetical protein
VFLELFLEDDSVLYLKKATLGCDSATIAAGASSANSAMNLRP